MGGGREREEGGGEEGGRGKGERNLKRKKTCKRPSWKV